MDVEWIFWEICSFCACSYCHLACKFQGQWQVNVLSQLCYVPVRDIISLWCKNTFPNSFSLWSFSSYWDRTYKNLQLQKNSGFFFFPQYQERSLMTSIWHFHMLQCEGKGSWMQSRYDIAQSKNTLWNTDYAKSLPFCNTTAWTHNGKSIAKNVQNLFINVEQRRIIGEEKKWEK